MKKLLSILLLVANSLTIFIGLGFLFGEDDEETKDLKQD